MARKDRVRDRIRDFGESRYWEVRKAGGGYGLYREENGRPVARLKPDGKGGFQVQKWGYPRERWQPLLPGSPVVLPLEDALEFIVTRLWCYL